MLSTLVALTLAIPSFADDARPSKAVPVGLTAFIPRPHTKAVPRAGDLKASPFPGFQRLLDRPDAPVHTRIVAAKSLAQLGDPRGLRILFEHATSNVASDRLLANAGLKAATGKDLADFGGHDFGERYYRLGVGAHTFRFTEEPVVLAENRVKRHASAAAFARWLKSDRPALYQVLANDD
ncbi:hypothetical protein [Singulisphaera sp. PoT]|uniref:hypothetical protein n=1 Tax=Singulisphaera sp. PoT TaxID=3411797 RepID=UPI003BF57FC1